MSDDSDDSEEESSDEEPVEESFPLSNRAMVWNAFANGFRQGSKDETTYTVTDWPVRPRVSSVYTQFICN